MKKTEMELQAIREKLAMLQADQPVADVAAMPWSSPQQAAMPLSQPVQPSQPTTEATPQALAIAALKQRSNNQSTHQAQSSNGYRQEADKRMGELISQEIYRLEVMAQNINERSQQQAAEILAMKRSAQQAAVALRRHGIHDHPQLDIIEQFLEPYPSAAVPRLERNSSGEFCLTHATINLHSAEQEAAHTAQTLRNRQTFHPQGQSALFSQAISSGPEVSDLLDDPATDYPTPISRRRSQQGWLFGLRRLTGWFGSDRTITNTDGDPAIAQARFSWMDAAIWFSTAAIARIVIEAIIVSFPFLRMPLLLILFSVISFAIYRVFTSKSSDFTAAYRLGITLLGLFVGGSF